MFKDQKRFRELVDPRLHQNFPQKALNQAVAVAAMCLQEEATVRPLIADVVMALSFLSTEPVGSPAPPAVVVMDESRRSHCSRSPSHSSDDASDIHHNSSSSRSSNASYQEESD